LDVPRQSLKTRLPPIHPDGSLFKSLTIQKNRVFSQRSVISPKKGCGAFWGRKQAAKKESNRVWREADKNESKPVTDSDRKSKD